MTLSIGNVWMTFLGFAVGTGLVEAPERAATAIAAVFAFCVVLTIGVCLVKVFA